MISILLLLLLLCLILFLTRTRWLPKAQGLRDRIRYSRLPFFRAEEDSSFEQNIEEGLSSSTFDLHQNLLDGGKPLAHPSLCLPLSSRCC